MLAAYFAEDRSPEWDPEEIFPLPSVEKLRCQTAANGK